MMTFLVQSVTLVLLTLILTNRHSESIIMAVTVVLTVLILAVADTPELLPDTLRSILSEMRRVMRP